MKLRPADPGKLISPFDPYFPLRDWGDGKPFRVADALTGVLAMGATGSGKTSGAAKHLALAYLAAGFGFCVLCAKKEERLQWEEWARLTGRTNDLVIFGVGSPYTFNFMNWEATRSGPGGGLTMNIVAMLDEIASALPGASTGNGGGDNQFFADAQHHMCMNAVDLCVFAGLPVTLPLLHLIVTSAPQTPEEAADPKWMESSACAAILRESDLATVNASSAVRADFEVTRGYWAHEFPALSEKTRSCIVLNFSLLIRPFITRPLRQLFGLEETNISPEACFVGKIVIVDMPVQEFHLAGKLANLAWKYCFQRAVMRRTPPQGEGNFLAPVVLWADEAQVFVSRFDATYQAVARSAGGCTVYLTQNRESFRLALGNDDAVDALLGNLQCKLFCQNGSISTNGWASALMGKRWIEVTSRTGGTSGNGLGGRDERVTASSSFSTSHQQRSYIEPVEFATLRRGGRHNDYLVDCLVYNGGERYPSADGLELVPYKFLTFKQRG